MRVPLKGGVNFSEILWGFAHEGGEGSDRFRIFFFGGGGGLGKKE